MMILFLEEGNEEKERNNSKDPFIFQLAAITFADFSTITSFDKNQPFSNFIDSPQPHVSATLGFENLKPDSSNPSS